MAKYREPEQPVVSDSESGEEDDEVSSEDVGSSESDSEPEPALTQVPTTKSPSTAGTKKPQPQPVSKPLPQPASKTPYSSSSSEEEEDESGSEPDSDAEPPVRQNVKPLASKPMNEPQRPTTSAAAKKLRSKPNASEPSTPLKATSAKRPAEEKETEAKDNKRSKKKPPSGSESSGKTLSTTTDYSKKQLFQRLWSEDDEIAVLEGMIEYAAKKKSDPVADLTDFHNFIRDNLHVDVTRTQLQDKIRRLKKKYGNNKSKEKGGKERTFSKAHEQKAYDLSKKIWGNEKFNGSVGEKVVGSPKANETAVKKTPGKGVKVDNVNSKEVKPLEEVNRDVQMMPRSLSYGSSGGAGGFAGTSTREWILRKGAEFFEGEKRIEGQNDWRRLRLEEIELEGKMNDVKSAQAKLVLSAFRSTEH